MDTTDLGLSSKRMVSALIVRNMIASERSGIEVTARAEQLMDTIRRDVRGFDYSYHGPQRGVDSSYVAHIIKSLILECWSLCRYGLELRVSHPEH